MNGIVASINQRWENLSEKHESLIRNINDVLNEYISGNLKNFSYLVVGVFGSGKTQLLIEIFKKSIDLGILPIYVFAEDLFENIPEGTTPQRLKEHVNEFVDNFRILFEQNHYNELKKILKCSEGSLKWDLLNYLIENRGKIHQSEKIVLLVDELEGQYKSLKKKIKTDDLSPLREWLEDRSYLKFLSLAPSGVYELGGADETRVKKFTIPQASVEYLREKYRLSAGKANALWWISRGKARHIIKNVEVIKSLSPNNSVYEIRRELEELDRIGQSVSSVPAVNFDCIKDNTKIRYLIDLAPIEDETGEFGLIMDVKKLDEGKLANIISEVFKTSNEDSLSIAYYIKMATTLISDKDFRAYIPQREFGEFFKLALDLLLENEQEKLKTIISKCYEEIEKENIKGQLMYKMSTLGGVELGNLPKRFPFEIKELRDIFPFPTINPIIFSPPSEVKERLGIIRKPFCKIKDNVLFFASYMDFIEYTKTDEFKNKVIPDGKYLIIILSSEELEKHKQDLRENSLLEWLIEQGKLDIRPLSAMLRDFMLSIYKEGKYNPPIDIRVVKSDIEDTDDKLMKRRFYLYYSSLKEYIEETEDVLKSRLRIFFEEDRVLPGAESSWGDKQVKEDKIVVPGLALAFYPIPIKDKEKLSKLAKLFGSKRGGGLSSLMPRKGYPTVADDLLPRGKGEDTNIIEKVRMFWSEKDKKSLEQLARILLLEDFKKLGNGDINKERLLEAFWRAVRNEFDDSGLPRAINRFHYEIAEKIEEISAIDGRIRREFELNIIYDNKDERKIMDSAKAFEELRELVDSGFESKLGRHILQIYLEGLCEKNGEVIKTLYQKLKGIDKKLNELEVYINRVVDLLENDSRLRQYVSNREQILEKLKLLKQFEGKEIEIENVMNIVIERINELRRVESILDNINKQLEEFESILMKHDLVEGGL
ncbi:hypothetical protein [Thermococcus sp. LS2]|uniref:hypothetical protein n=1 Tax=Thermococcus sp. LS2 TaxID=1638260 RepID=UPI001439964B|nr:hypothetical protein [Thermococcus sp. LS2]NJE13778.1 hypothetical protein [Thermococcus sp. LS2]